MTQAMYNALAKLLTEKLTNGSKKWYVYVDFLHRGEPRYFKFTAMLDDSKFIDIWLEEFGKLKFITITSVMIYDETTKSLLDLAFNNDEEA